MAARTLAWSALFAAACSASSPAVTGGHRPSTGDDASTSAEGGVDASDDASTPADASAEGGDAGGDASAPARFVAYASGYGPNIDVFSLDDGTGTLTPVASTPAFGSSPSFLAVNRAATNLYAVDENATGRVGAYAIDPATGALSFLGAVSSGGNGPPFVSVDATGRWVFVANYGDGTVSVLPVTSGGALGAPVQTLSVGAEAHMIVADASNRFVFVPCKGADYVAQFLFDATSGKLAPNATPQVSTAAGAGPRHLAFHPNGRFAYLVNETNSTMTAYALDGSVGTLSEIQTLSTLPPGYNGPTNTAAEVWVHPSGQWLFGSNRGQDSIVDYAIDPSTGQMTFHGYTTSGGTTPRDFTLDPSGHFLFVANQGTGNVVPFSFDATKVLLQPIAPPVTVPSASFVGVVALPGH